MLFIHLMLLFIASIFKIEFHLKTSLFNLKLLFFSLINLKNRLAQFNHFKFIHSGL